MYKRKIIFLFGFLFLISACSDTLSSVKRGLTGEKEIATDEFLVQKKDPLIMPPDFENLPAPDEEVLGEEQEVKISSFEETMGSQTMSESEEEASSSSSEISILKKIKEKR